ncbi:MAG: UvrD-helicase domain-containing protein, partial [Methanobrevibacter sp.]|nr:UvrD-helicase domain-containing protein [Methanobrevibacter sp.]
MDFCPRCGGIILHGTKCSKCGFDKNSSNFEIRTLKIKPYSKYISLSEKKLFENNVDLLIGLIENFDQLDLTSDDLIVNIDNIIDISNEKFIENERKFILKQFREELNSRERYISDSDKFEFKNKYNKDYCNYYVELEFDKKIDLVNKQIIRKQKDIVYIQFKEELNSYNHHISDLDKEKLKEKYFIDDYDFYSELKCDFHIEKFNERIIQKQKDIVYEQFKEDLKSYDNYISDLERDNLKEKYYVDGFDYYNDLNCDFHIDRFNEGVVEKQKDLIISNLKDEYIPYSEKINIENKLNLNFDISEIIDEHNDNFIKKQMKLENDFFDNVDNRTLDINQRIAVLTDDDNTQIVAVAGTGKTLTIQAKVKYLIEKQGILPEDILCISFSNSARDDLARKLKRTIGEVPVEVRTFHSLGYSILGQNGQGKEVPEYEISNLIKNYFKESFSENSDLIKDIVEFFCYYYNIVLLGLDNLKLETFKSRLTTLNEYDEYLSEYLQITNVKKKKEYMSNVKDLIVSNFLFIHNIKYEYSKQAILKVKDYDKYKLWYFNFLFSNLNEYIPEDIKLDFIYELHENFASTKFKNYPNFYLPEKDLYIDLIPVNSNWENILDDEKKEKIS